MRQFLVALCARHEGIAPCTSIEGDRGEGEDERDSALDEGPDDPFRAEIEHLTEEIEDHADEEAHERQENPPPRVLVRCLTLTGKILGRGDVLGGHMSARRRGIRLPVWGSLVFPALVRQWWHGRLSVVPLRLRRPLTLRRIG